MINYGRRIGSHEKPAYGTVITDPFHPLSQGLVGYWMMNEGGGNRAYDISGHGNHGTLTNGPTWGGSKFGGGLSFDGTDDYVGISRVVQDDFTIEFWFKSTQVAGTDDNWYRGMGLVDGEVSSVTNDFGTSLGNGKVLFGTGNPDVTIRSGSVADGIWHHVVATRVKSTGAIELYIDGGSVATGTGGTQSLTSPPNLRIGSIQTAINFFNGTIDEVRIYNRALSAEEIKQLYHDPFCNLLRVPIRRYAGGLTILDFERPTMRGVMRGVMRGIA